MKKEVKALIKNGPFCKVLDKIEEKKCHRAYLKRINTITKQGAYIVHEIEGSLNDSGLTFFATCGTLLGLIREGRLLKNDYDMDYGILIEKPDDWKTLSVALSKIGYRKIREFSLNQRVTETSVYKGYKQDKIEMRGDRAEMSDFPLYLNTVAGGLDRRDQTIGGFSFVVKIYAVPVVEIIGQLLYLLGRYGFNAQFGDCL